MSSERFLLLRKDSSQYHFRRAVPTALRSLLGRSELTGSLGTDGKREAKARLRRLFAATETLFSRLEGNPTPSMARAVLLHFAEVRRAAATGEWDIQVPVEIAPTAGVPASADVTSSASLLLAPHVPTLRQDLRPTQFPHLLQKYRVAHLQGDDVLRGGCTREELPPLRAMLVEYEQALRDAMALGDISAVTEAATAQLEAEGFNVRSLSKQLFDSYCRVLLPVELSVVRDQLARLNGEVVLTPEFPPDPVAWDDVFLQWVKVQAPKPRSRADAQAAFKRLKEFLDGKPPSEVNEEDAQRFRMHLLETTGLSRHRVKTLISLVRPVFQVARDEKVPGINSNPFANVKVSVASDTINSYYPFEVGHLNELLRTPVYTTGLRPAKGGGIAAFWIPLIGLFTGKRLEAIGALKADDFSVVAGRDWFRALAKKGKLDNPVPLHLKLIELGLMDYIEQRRMEGGPTAALFPMFKPSKSRGTFTHAFSTWFNEYLDKYVIDDRRYAFHSFRNSFEEALTEARVREDVRRELCGHAQAGMTARYGRKNRDTGRRTLPRAQLVEAIDALVYEGLDLSHLTV